MLINVRMPIVGILTFMSKINFLLSRVEHENSFITLGSGFCLCVDALYPSQQFFSHIRMFTCLLGLNQY